MVETIAGREVIARPLEHGPSRQTPRRIVVHAMAYQLDYEGERLYAAEFLDRIGLSAHMLIAPDGSLIRCREDDQAAWHAKGFNTDSLGVEVLVPGVYSYQPFVQRIAEPWPSRAQFQATLDLLRHWQFLWKIGSAPGELDRHSDLDPGRKSDPGRGFDWVALKNRLGARNG